MESQADSTYSHLESSVERERCMQIRSKKRRRREAERQREASPSKLRDVLQMRKRETNIIKERERPKKGGRQKKALYSIPVSRTKPFKAMKERERLDPQQTVHHLSRHI